MIIDDYYLLQLSSRMADTMLIPRKVFLLRRILFFLEGIISFDIGFTFQKLHCLHFELSERVEKGHFFSYISKLNQQSF